MSERAKLISTITTPLHFLVLGLLVIEGTLTFLAMRIEAYQETLLIYILVSVPLFVLIVVLLAVFRPEALTGDRPLQEMYARTFASDLVFALDGALSNLPPTERAEAWVVVADVVETSEDRNNINYARFCTKVAARIRELAKIKGHDTGSHDGTGLDISASPAGVTHGMD